MQTYDPSYGKTVLRIKSKTRRLSFSIYDIFKLKACIIYELIHLNFSHL